LTDIEIADVSQHVGEEIRIKGWLYNRRSSGKVHFMLVRDGTGTIQAVVGKGEVSPEVFELADSLGQESSIVVSGVVRADARAPGGYELVLSSLEVVQSVSDYPISPKEHGVAFLMAHRHLWLRSRRQLAILKVRAELVRACRDFFDDRGFVLIDAPIFTPAAVEGTTTLFEVGYFNDTAFLTQSGQLYMEAACMALGKVYCFGPTFRAEKSKTRRHLTEFWMIEPEVAYCDLEGDMRLAEELVVYVVERILEKRREELDILERDTAPLERVRAPFPRISYDDAVKRLQEEGSEFTWGSDFGAPDETLLSNQYDQPFHVHHFPVGCKAFYMKRDEETSKHCRGFDTLAPEGYGEIIGGGQREDNLENLERRIAEHGLPREAFEWYLDLRRYGSVPHAGFGLGLERTLAWICNLPHLRETIPFPRLLDTVYP